MTDSRTNIFIFFNLIFNMIKMEETNLFIDYQIKLFEMNMKKKIVELYKNEWMFYYDLICKNVIEKFGKIDAMQQRIIKSRLLLDNKGNGRFQGAVENLM